MSKYKTLLDQMASSNSQVLTATLRLAQQLTAEFNQQQLAHGKSTWPSAPIDSFSHWCKTLWNQYCERIAPGYTLLGDFHQYQIWQTIVDASPQGADLLSSKGAANEASQAEALLCAWRLTLSAEDCVTDDTQAFFTWLHAYRDICTTQKFIPSQELPWRVIDKLQTLPLPFDTVILAGFDESTPVLDAFTKAVTSRNIEIIHWQAHTPNPRIARIALPTAEDEIKTMAKWANKQIQENENVHIGCIVPELPALRNKIEQVFFAECHPEHFMPDNEVLQPIFNISAGRCLADYPIIHTALLSLQSLSGQMAVADIAALLHSPYLASGELELLKRSGLAALLYEIGCHEYTMTQLCKYAEKKRYLGYNVFCPQLIACLQALPVCPQEKISLAAWASIIGDTWAALGWPGERIPGSHEYQAISRLQLTLEEFANLPGEYHFSAALAILCELCKRTPFQAQSGHTQVHILGALEASGFLFDKVWVLGLHDAIWPPPASPNPLLPLALQRKHHLPHATHARELAFTKLITTRLCHSAPEIIISYPEHRGEQQCFPSALITQFEMLTANNLLISDTPTLSEEILATRSLETYHDEQAPPLTHYSISGGSQIFKLQAACPFRAFAEIRLGAKSIGTPYDGLNALERGTCLHRVLERFWQQVGGQQALKQIPDGDLQERIDKLVWQSLQEVMQKSDHRPAPKFRALEQTRLSHLIYQYLLLEKERPPFTVCEIEKRRQVKIHGLEINLTCDRIDETASGEMVIIDYKSGRPTVASWFGDRPDDPQLPLYCITSTLPISGLVFAEIRAGNIRFRGVMNNETLLPGTKTPQKLANVTWADMQTEWERVIHELAGAFTAGDARVAPKDPNVTCTYCQCAPLCRIKENRPASAIFGSELDL